MHSTRYIPIVLTLLGACAPVRPSAHQMTTSDSAHLGAMTREHADETPAPNASAAEPRMAVTAEEVAYGTVDGKVLRGYLARPSGAAPNAPLPGLLVIHEWWGLNDNVRMMTRRLAGEGYTALAVDLYGQPAATTPEGARALMQSSMSDPAAGTRNLAAAAAYLHQRGTAKLGVVGWCFGGGWSLQAALRLPEQIDAAVMYYGQPVVDRDSLARLDAPLLGLFGGADTGIPATPVREMEATLRTLRKDVQIEIYPGAKHAFANPSGQSYDPAAAADAWRRTVQFFARHLQPASRL